MFLSMKRLAAALFVLSLACSPDAVAQQPPRSFKPSLDFFPVPNDPWVDEGDCLGMVESAVAHWSPTIPEDKRLAKLGNDIMGLAATKKQGYDFLKDINFFTQNHSITKAVTPLQTGDRLADLLLADLKFKKKPQVLGLADLPVGKDKKKHALVVYDGEKLNGRTVFKVGDPNYPNRDDLMLAYDKTNRTWKALNFPKESPLNISFTPCFVHWDKDKKRNAEIPNETFWRIMKRVEMVKEELETARKEKKTVDLEARAKDIGSQFQLLARPKWGELKMEREFDRPADIQPPPFDVVRFNAALADYERDVAEHNRKVASLGAFEQRQQTHVSYAEKFNEAARKYNSLPQAQRTEAEAGRLRSLRDNVTRVAAEIAQVHAQLSSQKDNLVSAKKSLDALRVQLVLAASGLQIKGVNPTVARELAFVALRSVTLESVAEPAQQQHPLIGSWTITSGFSKGQTLAFEAGGRYISNFPAAASWRSTGANSGEATLTYDTPGLAFTCTYQITIENGRGTVTYRCDATRGRVDPPSGTFQIQKR